MPPQPLGLHLPGHRLATAPLATPIAAGAHRQVCCHASQPSPSAGTSFAATHESRQPAATHTALAAAPSRATTSGRESRLSVVCMAHPRRVAKVASQIQREVSRMFIEDEVMVRNITPERAGGSRELSALLSVTDVYVANDLQYVKVYVSIYSDERGKQRAMRNLKRLEPYVRRQMGQRVPLRLTPMYIFEYDDAQEELDLMARMIGDEDMERYTREIITSQQQGQQAPGSTQAPVTGSTQQANSTAAAVAPDTLGDSDGFLAFDELNGADADQQGVGDGSDEEEPYDEDFDGRRGGRGSGGRSLGPFDQYFGDYEEPAVVQRPRRQGQGSRGGQRRQQGAV